MAQASEVRVAATNERIRIIAEKRSDIVVDGGAKLDQAGASLTIEGVGDRLTVRIPEGTDIVVGTTSARVEIEGAAGVVAVTTESGRISVEAAESVDARTVNGRIKLGRIEGDCRVRTHNGRVEVKSCASPDVATRNGRVHLSDVDGVARAHSVSGRISIEMSSAHDVFAETVNGRIDISMPHGVRVLRLDEIAANPVDREEFDSVVDARSSTGRVSVSER